eukprot:TRINITY_DN2839_c0_g1_i5.p1 TRINITY_DN2839_c0_g1~~TRINITY_DN2839_c0_g1_i5.p1  ORF type:complete len:452 (+),score=31.31 TRINITY_DN2839_c0_g1_i5:30-1358(+)
MSTQVELEDVSLSNIPDDALETRDQTTSRDGWVRWVMLALYCVAALMTSVVWITFAPIYKLAEEFYGVGYVEINMLSVVFLVVYVLLVFPSMWVLDHWSLRGGVRVGVVLTVGGTWIRLLGSIASLGYPAALIGQIIAAAGQPFLLNAAPKVSVQWFPAPQRGVCTAIGSLAPVVGAGIGYLLPPAMAHTPNQVRTMLLYLAIIMTFFCGLTLLFFRDRPTSSLPSTMTFVESLKHIGRDPQSVLLLVLFAWAYGAFNTFATVVGQLFAPFGYSEGDIGMFGALTILLGVLGCVCTGVLLDRYRWFRGTMTVSLVAGTLVTGALTLCMRRGLTGVIATANGVLGFVMLPMLVICMEWGCEHMYPVPEGTVTGLLLGTGNFLGIFQIVLTGHLADQGKERAAGWFMAGCVGLSLLLSFFFRGQFNRSNYEKTSQQSTATVTRE